MQNKIGQTIVMALATMLTLSGCEKTFELRSSVFRHNEIIPDKYCYGYGNGRENVSIPLNWVNPPEGTQSFALIFYHPDHNYIQWAVFNIPANSHEIVENASGKNMPGDSIELPNFRRTTKPYYGPDPQPGGVPYKYIATLFALNVPVINGLDQYKSYWEINKLLEGKVIAKAELIGIQSKERRAPLFSLKTKENVRKSSLFCF